MGSEGSGGALDALAPVSSRLRIGVGAAIVLVLMALVVAVVVALLGDAAGTSQTLGVGEAAPGAQASAVPSAQAPPELLVHVLGAVVTPGLYSLREGGRVIDAVAAAGGLSDDADQAGINLARPVSDGEQIIVPRAGEVPPPGAGGAGGGSASAGGKININVATASELEELPRVGPAMAARIIEWREANGRFTSVEDLLSVTGIGEKTLDGLRDLVSV